MRICVDLDGVLCRLRAPGEGYEDLEPIEGAAAALRGLRQAGHYIIIATARHMRTTAGNPSEAVAKVGSLTLDWLSRHGIPFDEIQFGKPHADVYIDDNALRFRSWEELRVDRLPTSTESRVHLRRGGAETVVIMAMAGPGWRFRRSRFWSDRAGKPLIDVAGRPMLWWALRSFADLRVSKLVFVVSERQARDGVAKVVEDIVGSLVASRELSESPVDLVIQPEAGPRGQLAAALAAREHLEHERGVLIAGADTFVVSGLGERIGANPDDAGLVSVFPVSGQRWSFVRAQGDRVVEVAEKRRISDLGGTGLYYFAVASEFCRLAEQKLSEPPDVNDEYYVMPLYGKYLERGRVIRAVHAKAMYEMGTPDSLERFLAALRATFASTTPA